nr:retrovirus-related Pol polyprotein from transposon TNT 1-94 [Tanacetum cinerariifolium]
EEEIDFEEFFALVARLEAVRIFLAFASHINMIVYHMYVKMALLNGILRKKVYVSQPNGFVYPDNPNHMCMLKKALYGLKQAPPKYALESLIKYGMKSCDHVDTSMEHLHAVKRIFQYLRGTINWGLWYSKDYAIALTAFVDADHAGCQDTRRRTSEKIADANHAGCQDTRCSTSGSLSKHIDIRYHIIKEHVENGVIELYFVNTEYQLADHFTKALGRERI